MKKKKLQALKQVSRLYCITGDQKNIKSDFFKAIAKHVAWLRQLKALAKKALETSETRFY